MCLMSMDFSTIPVDRVRALCERRGIRRLAVFGSALRDDFRPESDLDLLAEFAPGVRVGLVGFQAIENELTDLIGRKVDLNTRGFLSPAFVEQVAREAWDLYVAA